MDTGDYYELTIQADEPRREVLIAELSEIGYEGFEESNDTLKAYISFSAFSEPELIFLSNKYAVNYSKSVIKKQNWNKVWESNFDPVRVDDFVGIRASFHPAFEEVAHDIVITPKMSFGTGHHATTWMMMQLMREIDFINRSVFDFGTGTGILAILAEKLGASQVLAADNDDWCIENASENILINRCNNIEIQKIDTVNNDQKFDIILANINKHIILDNIDSLIKNLGAGGQLLLSGLLKADEADILSCCVQPRLVHTQTIERAGWIAMKFFMN